MYVLVIITRRYLGGGEVVWAVIYFLFVFQAHPPTAFSDDATAEGLMAVRKPVAAAPHLSD